MSLGVVPSSMAAIPTVLRPTLGQPERVALLTEPLDKLVLQKRLQEIPGVGEAIAGVITQLCQTGSHPSLEKMRADVPESVLEMLSIPGLRPDKIMKLHKEIGINTIDELEKAVGKID